MKEVTEQRYLSEISTDYHVTALKRPKHSLRYNYTLWSVFLIQFCPWTNITAYILLVLVTAMSLCKMHYNLFSKFWSGDLASQQFLLITYLLGMYHTEYTIGIAKFFEMPLRQCDSSIMSDTVISRKSTSQNVFQPNLSVNITLHNKRHFISQVFTGLTNLTH